MGSTGFNLDQSIANHVQLIKGQGSTTSSDEAELAAHLYDSCEDLVGIGLSEEESFLIARRRLGDMEVLTEEYSKVNATVSTNRIWAYLLIGASLITGVWQSLLLGSGYFYLTIFRHFNTSHFTVVSVTIYHILLICLTWYTVKRKQDISRYLEDNVGKNPIRTVVLSFIPLILVILIPAKMRAEFSAALNFPVYRFENDVVQFSFYLLMSSLAAGFLSLVFSLKKTQHISLKSVFEKPSPVFLILFGFIIELLAASTRVIRIESIIGSGFVFGLVYLVATFLVCYYNQNKGLLKYVLMFSAIGFILDLSAGVIADMDRGDTYFTAYFATGLVLGVLSGGLLGIRMKQSVLAD